MIELIHKMNNNILKYKKKVEISLKKLLNNQKD